MLRPCSAPCSGRDSDDTFTIRQWDGSGTTLVDTIASAQNLHVARAAFREYVIQYPKRRMTLQIAAHVIDEHVPSRYADSSEDTFTRERD